MSLKPLIDAMAHADAESLVRAPAYGLGLSRLRAPLYPAGDPRAAALLESLALPSAYADLARQVERLAGERPNIDFGLAALSAVHRLPSHAPLALFAIGRCVGWLAHALEQAGSGQMIRPRALRRRFRLSRRPSHRRPGTSPGGTGKA